MSYLHDHRVWPIGASQKMCHELDRLLRCGKADAREALAGQMIKALQRKSQVCAALVVGHGVNFVNDHGLDGSQDLAALRGSYKDGEGFRGGDQTMRRMRQH